MARRLIVNADDLGYTPGVSAGIFRAHLEGIVTSTTAMVNMPDAADAIAQAITLAPRLGLGLHLTLTAGKPVSPLALVPDLVQQDGTFLARPELISTLPEIDRVQIEQELRAQVNRFIDLAGRPPDHLDSHHHSIFMSPSSAQITLSLARELQIPVRRPLPTHPEQALEGILRLGMDEQSATAERVEPISAAFRDSGVPTPDYFLTDFYGKTATLGDLLNLLLALPDGITELMCHPAEIDERLGDSSSYVAERAIELGALTHPSTRELIQSQGIELITFADVRG